MFTRISNWIQNTIATLILLVALNSHAQPIHLKAEADMQSGLASNNINALKKAINGTIWVGTEKGLELMGEQDSVFRTIKTFIGAVSVRGIEFCKNYIFVATRINGLYIFEHNTGRLKQSFDTSSISLCRRIRVIGDTIYLTTNKVPFYFIYQNGKWEKHKLIASNKSGFFTDLCKFNNKIYVTSYGETNTNLYEIRNDSLIPTADIKLKQVNPLTANTLSINTDGERLMIGGDGFYQIIDKNGKSSEEYLRNKEKLKYFPSWDVTLLNGRGYIGIGYPDNIHTGMLFSTGKSNIEDLKNNFYGQVLTTDHQNRGLWIGTANRGVFYWQFPNKTIELGNGNNADGVYYSNAKDIGILFNNKSLSIIDWEKENYKTIIEIDPRNPKTHTLNHATYWKDTIAIIGSAKVFLYDLKGMKINEFSFVQHYEHASNKIVKLADRLILFSSFYDVITEIYYKTGKISYKRLKANNAFPTLYKNGILYTSNYNGFHFYDTTSHSFTNSPVSVENFCIKGDTLWTINNGMIKAFRIDIHTHTFHEIISKNYQQMIEGFIPYWINTANNKIVIGNAKGFLELSQNNGDPIKYNYIGNFSVLNPPVSDGQRLIYNLENQLLSVIPDIDFNENKALSIKLNINPSEDIYQNFPFIFNFTAENYLQLKNSLKEVIIYRNNKIFDTLYTISDKLEFTNGLPKGNYTFHVKYNGISIEPIQFTVKVELLDSPFLYAGIMLLFGMIGLLIFRSVIIQKSYEKQILNNRLQLLKQNLNPHFVFNSLNLIYSLVLQNKNDAAIKTIGSFSDLHRYFLDNVNQTEITLAEELKFINSYLNLEAERVEHDNKFEYHLPKDLPEHISECLVPPMILQPLIENAIKYSDSDQSIRKMWIDITEQDSLLIIGVENTISQYNTLTESGFGMGLSLVRERIEIYNKSLHKQVQLRTKTKPIHDDKGFRTEIIFRWYS